jgi:hypothetical protein
MNTFNDHHAETKAGRLARAARRAAVAGVLVLGAGSAFAQHGDRRDDQGGPPQQNAQDGQRPGRFYLPQQDRDPRRDNGRYNDDRGMQQQQQDQGGDRGRGGRMTPDERRDLRRQINEAGADLYQRKR